MQNNQDNITHGVISGLLAFFCLSVMSAFIKILSESHHIIEVAFYRNAIPALILLAFILGTRKFYLFHTNKPYTLLARVLIGTGALILTFMAIAALPLAEATILFFTSTLILPILSVVFLKEHVGKYRILAIITGFIGVILIVAPSGEFKTIGVGLALSAAVGQAIIQIFLRHLRTENPITLTFYFLLGGTLIPGIFMPFIAEMPQMESLWIILGAGIFGGAAQLFLSYAFRCAPVTIVAPLNYTSLIWASGFDILIWNIVPGPYIFLGGTIIIASNLFIIHREKLAK